MVHVGIEWRVGLAVERFEVDRGAHRAERKLELKPEGAAERVLAEEPELDGIDMLVVNVLRLDGNCDFLTRPQADYGSEYLNS